VLFVVQAAKDPDFNDTIVDKCTVMAAGNRLPLVIVINKSDLDRPDVSIYEKAGTAACAPQPPPAKAWTSSEHS
jgi:putative ribosome biogenesis GTPase RsgA